MNDFLSDIVDLGAPELDVGPEHSDRPEPGVWLSLDPMVRRLWRFYALLSAAWLAPAWIVPLVLYFIRGERTVFLNFALGALATSVLVAVISYLLVNRSYDCWKYRVTDDDLGVKRGIFWRTEVYIPRRRVQHLDITSGPLQRKLGLCSVSVFVAGGVGATLSIPGLSQAAAAGLKEEMLGDQPASL
ncbi:MAG: PH domain-containing protein [Fimbriimonadaceae bacterium]